MDNWSDYPSGVPQREYEAVPPSLQARYAGVYEALDRPPLVVVFEGDKLFARSGEDAWFRLYPASETTFFATANESRWTFVKSAGGTVSEVIARTRDTEVHRQRAK